MENEEQNSLSVFSEIIKNIGTLISCLVAGSVVISIFYDWVFFNALGISLLDAPTTLTDYLETWLLWLPFAVLITLLGFFLIICIYELAYKFISKYIKHIDLPAKITLIIYLIICFVIRNYSGIKIINLWIITW